MDACPNVVEYIAGMDSTVQRPWYRWHWQTWLMIALTVLALGNQQRLDSATGDLHHGGGMYHNLSDQGWPYECVTVQESGWLLARPTELPTFKFHWRVRPASFNVAICLILIACTAFVVERWTQHRHRFRLSLVNLLTLMMVTSVLIAVLHVLRLLSWDSLLSPLAWPLLFAFGCTIYTAGWLAWYSSHVLLARLHRNR